MKLFFVNLFARDTTNCRDLPSNQHEGLPWRCFSYVVLAESSKHAEEIIIQHSTDMGIQWEDRWCYAQDPEGTDLATAVFVDACDVSTAEAWSIRRNRGKLPPSMSES